MARLNSRRKGKTGELELAAYLRDHGYNARRGRQYHGGQGSPDVTGVPGIHIECKRCEKGNLYDWMQQASDEAGSNIPVVMHRRNGKQWVAVINLDYFLRYVRNQI